MADRSLPANRPLTPDEEIDNAIDESFPASHPASYAREDAKEVSEIEPEEAPRIDEPGDSDEARSRSILPGHSATTRHRQ